MEDNRTNESPETCTMNGGKGPNSYAQNSNYQRGVVEAAKEIINEAVAEKFNIKHLFPSSNTIKIADLGCSTGPNTFLAVENILKAIELKYHTQKLNSQIPEFQVFFNDHVSNDFNTLFKSLPPNRQYFAAGVPGSFYGLLFPKASLHFIHSSYALHWLSKVPEEIVDRTSPAWNKGRIHYTSAPKEVLKAYSAQFAKDMESFLYARAQELVGGGLIALLIPAVHDNILSSQTTTGTGIDLLGSCLMDMTKMGLISEAKVDYFNLPMYYTSPKELRTLIERNVHFSIERMEELNNQKKHVAMPNPHMRSMYIRAVLEGIIEQHFGRKIVDELFNRYSKKAADSSFFLNPENQKSIVIFVLLNRNTDD